MVRGKSFFIDFQFFSRFFGVFLGLLVAYGPSDCAYVKKEEARTRSEQTENHQNELFYFTCWVRYKV